MDFGRFGFSWTKMLVGFIPDNFSTTLIYETLRNSATIISSFTSFSPSKREILFSEMNPLFVKKALVVFKRLLFAITPLDLILVI